VAKRAQTHVERYKQLCRETARHLKVKQNDPRVEHVATLKLMREGIQARLLSGHYVEPSEVLRLDEALARYMPAADPLEVKLTFVENVRGVYKCKHCHEWNELAPGEYEPLKPKPSDPPPVIDLDAEVVKPEAKALPAPAADTRPVEPPPRVHPGSIHDQPGVPTVRRTLACL
jgi:hypothetical protein